VAFGDPGGLTRCHHPRMPNVIGFDHLVLLVADTERSVAWYRDVLGMPIERLEEWRRKEVFFPSVRISPTALIDIIPRGAGDPHDDRGDGNAPSRGNVDHFCLVVDDDVHALAASGAFEIVDGPDTRWGAQGDATSLYVKDPDGNVVELRRY
jgi:catechol 2,3-dioxygenase-like lactoylglutathione lyase family enzyme